MTLLFNRGENQEDQTREIIPTPLFFLLLFVFQLILIFQGLDLSDEGFMATFYQQIFKNPESVQYEFMFWLTGIIGGLYFKLFSFLGLWGLRLGGVAITTATAMLTHKLLKRYLNPNYLKLGLFLVVITLNNDIKELNYNNLSAFVYVAVILCLFSGLKASSYWKLFLSGLLVSVNVFIRPPNILGLGLALAICYHGYESRSRFAFVAKQILVFAAGFLSCTALLLLVIRLIGHWNIFTGALGIVFKMGQASHPAETHDSYYGFSKLLQQLKSNNFRSLFISLCIFVALALGVYIFSTVKKKISFISQIRWLLKGLFLLIVMLLIARGIIDRYFTLFFYSGIIVLVFMAVLVTSENSEIKLLLFCGCFLLVVYPFGSSAGLYTAGRYALWIGLPLAINYLFDIRYIENKISFYSGKTNHSFVLDLTANQISVAKKLLVLLLVFDGLFYSYFHPFFDKHNRLDMRYSVDNKYLTGIYITKGRAEVLNELLQESSKYVKKGDYVLAYDCIPLYHFLTESVPYMRSPYPWLYETAIFKSELDFAAQQRKPLPVVIMQTIQTIGDGSKWPEETLPTDYSKWNVNEGRNEYLNQFLQEHNYRQVWSNNSFKILIPADGREMKSE